MSTESTRQPGWWARRRKRRADDHAVARQAEAVTAAVFHTEAEARFAQGALINAGIDATVRNDNPDYGMGFVEASRVIVRRRDLAETQSLLKEIEQGR